MSSGESERAKPKELVEGEKELKSDATAKREAEGDDITMGEEAQKHRDKMLRQEKAEGDRR